MGQTMRQAFYGTPHLITARPRETRTVRVSHMGKLRQGGWGCTTRGWAMIPKCLRKREQIRLTKGFAVQTWAEGASIHDPIQHCRFLVQEPRWCYCF